MKTARVYTLALSLQIVGCPAGTDGDGSDVSPSTLDSGSVPPPTLPPIPDTSCLAGVVPALPPTPSPAESLEFFVWGNLPACSEDSWELALSVGGYSTGFGKGRQIDALHLQAWDLRTGAVSEYPGELIEVSESKAHRLEVWGLTVHEPELPCSVGTYTAFSGTAVHGGEPVSPAALRDPSSPVDFNVWSPEEPSFNVEAVESDEVWIWVTYPRRLEAWGPFPAARQENGLWYLAIDSEIGRFLPLGGAVYAAIGCRAGTHVGTSVTTYAY